MHHYKDKDLNIKDLYHIYAAAVLTLLIILLDGVLLGIALRIENPTWAAGFLVLSAVLLSLIGLLAVIAILTKIHLYFQNLASPAVTEIQNEVKEFDN